MALQKVNPGLLPAENFRRFGVAFDLIDFVRDALDGKASKDQVDDKAERGDFDALVGRVNAKADGADLTDLSNFVAAIRKALDGKASTDQVEAKVEQGDFDVLARTVADKASASALGDLSSRLGDLASAFAQTQATIADLRTRLLREAASGLGRPGDTPSRYALAATAAAVADLVSAPDVPAGMIAGSAGGLVVTLTGSAILARRAPIALEPDRLYRVRYVVARRANASDPAGDAVVPGLVYLDQSGRPIANLVPPSAIDPTGSLVPVATLDMLIRASGRKQIEALIARAPGLGATLPPPPAAARYAVPVLVTYGLDGVTDVEVMHDEDVTGAFVVAPPVAAFEARLANIESLDPGPRLTALESTVGTPSMLVFPTKGDASTGNIPSSVQFAQLLGGTTGGDGRGGLYQRYTGTPPAGADQFTTTGGAVFVRVGIAADIAAALLSVGYVPWVKGLPTEDPGGTDQAWFSYGTVQVTR